MSPPSTNAKRDGASDAFGHHKGAAKRRRNHKQLLRTDRDGDLLMDMGTNSSNRIGKNRGRGGKNNANRPQGPVKNFENQKNAFNRLNIEGQSKKPPPLQPPLRHLRLLGLEKSKAYSNDDKGMNSLENWLEKRVNIAMSKLARERHGRLQRAQVKRARIDEDIFYFSVPAEQFSLFIRLDGYAFAGTKISIEEILNRPLTPTEIEAQKQTSDSIGIPNIRDLFHSFINRRYDATTKLLDLGTLGSDPDLVSVGMFNTDSTKSKFFPALMKFCDGVFDTPEQKRETVESVSLANNSLLDLEAITTLAVTFPDLKNLDLSNNSFEKLGSIQSWRNKFRSLDHLVISNNPLEQNVPNYHEKFMSWYPTLRFLNGIQIRTDAQTAEALNAARQVTRVPSLETANKFNGNVDIPVVQNGGIPENEGPGGNATNELEIDIF